MQNQWKTLIHTLSPSGLLPGARKPRATYVSWKPLLCLWKAISATSPAPMRVGLVPNHICQVPWRDFVYSQNEDAGERRHILKGLGWKANLDTGGLRPQHCSSAPCVTAAETDLSSPHPTRSGSWSVHWCRAGNVQHDWYREASACHRRRQDKRGDCSHSSELEFRSEPDPNLGSTT